MREKCPNTEFFWSVFSHTRAENGNLRRLWRLDTFHAVTETQKLNNNINDE